MKYFDLHCDALTNEGILQVTAERLAAGECQLQCFAAFISEREGRFASACALAEKFHSFCTGEGYHPVRCASELQEDKINALFTVEEGGAIEGSIQKLDALFGRGARMMTLTWNYPNEIGYPNFPDYKGLCEGKISPAVRETERGLTPFGFEAVGRMNELGMIVDVSHGSDRLVKDVASVSSAPFVASHSNARSVCDWARNLSDEQIRLIADCGGVIGLNFCADFLSADHSVEGQKEALLAHARAIVRAGGEDVLCIGSDFDGIPENPFIRDPSHMGELLDLFAKQFGERITEKIARKNFLRVFREVCG